MAGAVSAVRLLSVCVFGSMWVIGVLLMLGQIVCRVVCKIRGHRYEHLSEDIEKATKDVAAWANAYNLASLVVHVQGECSRCGDSGKTVVVIEGYLIDNKWAAMSAKGVTVIG